MKSIVIAIIFITIIVTIIYVVAGEKETSDNRNSTDPELENWIHLDSINSGVHLLFYDSLCIKYLKIQTEAYSKTLDMKRDLGLEWINEIDFRPFHHITEKYISIRFGCGSPCWYDLYIPVHENREIIKRDIVFFEKGNVIAYMPLDYDGVMFENFESGKKDSMHLDYSDKKWVDRWGGFFPANVDTMNYFNNRIFIGKYDSDNGKLMVMEKELDLE